MSDKAIAEKLFQELGPLLDPEAIVYDETEPQWAVVVDENTQIAVGYDEEDGQFVFALDLGDVPDQSAERVHELLLRFSYVWRGTGGLYTALDPEGRAILMYKHAVQGLDVQTLQALLDGLYTHSQYWAELIADVGDGDVTEGPENIAPFRIIRP